MPSVPHISDALWDRLRPIIAGGDPATVMDLGVGRSLVDAVLYRAITGDAWLDLPSELPHDDRAWQTYERWKRSGVLHQLSATLHVDLDDATIVPAVEGVRGG
ncbi:MAG TPA: transposase [Dehalococcoidia bacterium]|nr:transposase [Dehalococcoidia bacterium]